MLERERPEIVCVATHPGSHAAIVEAAATHGARAIFLEKPMALDLADCDRIIAACRSAGVLLSVNHSRRWYPVFNRARDLLRQGAIGELISMVGHCQGGKPSPGWQSELEGPLLHDATHLFDLMRLYAGDVRWLAATARRRTHTAYPVEDDSSALLQFHSGVSGVALVNELSDYVRFDIELQGTTGVMRLGLDEFEIARATLVSFEAARDDAPGFEWQVLKTEPLQAPPGPEPFAIAARELVDALEGRAMISSTGEDGRASLEIIMAIYESQRRGSAPVALPLPGGPSSLLALAREQGWRSPPEESHAPK
jgi:predicted dehydrogenase